MDNKEDLILSMNQSLANKFERLYKEELQKRKQAENELALIKGIGQNSPEQQSLKKELQEVKEDNRKLSLQISNFNAVSYRLFKLLKEMAYEDTFGKDKQIRQAYERYLKDLQDAAHKNEEKE